MSEEVDKKLSANLDQPIRLAPHEWASGEIFWLVEAVGDKRVLQAMIARMRETVFKDKAVKLRSVDSEGKRQVQIIAPGDVG